MEQPETVDCLNTAWAMVSQNLEFWSGIVGAILGASVGGLIAYAIQSKTLREGKRQRAADHRQIQEALGNGLVFKMLRVHSNIFDIHRYLGECFEKMDQEEAEVEPWQVFLPLVNPPNPVQFSADEMAMLLGLKDLETFNLVLPLDVVHNSLITSLNALNLARSRLTDEIPAFHSEGQTLTSVLDKEQYMALRPAMIEVNTLAESVKSMADDSLKQADNALHRLHRLLHENLGIEYRLELKVKKSEPAN